MGCGCAGRAKKKQAMNLNGNPPPPPQPRLLTFAHVQPLEIYATEHNPLSVDYTITTPNKKGPGVTVPANIVFDGALTPLAVLKVVEDRLETLQEKEETASSAQQDALDSVKTAIAYLTDTP